MKVKILMLLLIGILLSLIAGFGAFQYTRALESELASARASVKAFGETVAIPVPLRDLAPGTVLSRADFQLIRVPASYLPANVMQDMPPEAGGGSIALAALRAGALVLKGDIATPSGPDYGFILTGDARAIAVKAQNINDYIGRLKPGDPVDLLWTRDTGGGTTETRMLGSALRILALPGSSGSAGTGPLAGKLMLEGAHQEAMRVVEASAGGSFSILPSARKLSLEEEGFIAGPGDLAQLPLAQLDGRAGTGAGAAVQPRCQTAVIRGSERVMMDVPC